MTFTFSILADAVSGALVRTKLFCAGGSTPRSRAKTSTFTAKAAVGARRMTSCNRAIKPRETMVAFASLLRALAMVGTLVGADFNTVRAVSTEKAFHTFAHALCSAHTFARAFIRAVAFRAELAFETVEADTLV